MQQTNLIHGRRPLGTVAYIATPFVPEAFMWSFAQLLTCCAEYVAPNGYYIHPDHATGSGQIIARNELVKKMQGDWLLQIDSDHTFEPDLLLRMLTLFENNKLDVLTGIYHYKQPPHNPVLFQYEDGKYKAILGWDRHDEVKLLPIGAAGGGCLLVRRKVFDRIRNEQNAMPFDQCPPSLYDDFNFFERCRLLGIKCWCAPHVEALHLGIQGYGSADYDAGMFEPASSTMCEVGV